MLQGSRDIDIIPPDKQLQHEICQVKRQLPLSKLNVIVVSSLKRTQQTAQYYGFSTAIIEPLLDELDFGQYEGQPRSLLLKECKQWSTDPENLILGEPVSALKLRVMTFLQHYQQYDNILLFGHGSWIRAMIAIAQYDDLRMMNQLSIQNNQLHCIHC